MVLDTSLIDVFLKPGDWFVAGADHQIRTFLGSCVSITLWHPVLRIGGMSHFVLPTRGAAVYGQALDGHYGDEALQLMFNKLQQSGASLSLCQGKIVGGGNMFPDQMRHADINIGQRNGEAARLLLRQNGIPIVSECLFGIGHRQVIFDVSTGDVWSHQIKPIVQAIRAKE